MKLTILGCGGGIGAGARTTAMLLDDDILIDAGTGVGDMSLDEMARIDHIFVTHSHLDHVCCIPFLVDAVGRRRKKRLTVYGIEETIAVLRKHMFNGELWPDFTQLPQPDAACLEFRAIAPREVVSFGARKIVVLPANHVVPAVGYWLDSGNASLVFSGDTGPNDQLWEQVNVIGNLRYLLIETSFCNDDCELALMSRHLCPSLLGEEIRKLRIPAEIFVTHLKPAEREVIVSEIADMKSEVALRILQRGQVLEF